jgi:hypothetical protein
MKIISKPLVFLRYVMPILTLVFLSISFVAVVQNKEYERSVLTLIVPLFLLGLFYFLFKKFVWDLANEVIDNEDRLLVTKGELQIEIRLSNIMNISSSMLQNPPRLTLRLRDPCVWGSELSFSPLEPGFSLIRTRSKIADDLILRIDKIRQDESSNKAVQLSP